MPTLPTRETMTVEFKSEKSLSDNDIVLASVCLANAEGGKLYLGIENDGRVTGASVRRQDPHRLAALIANSTSPSLSVRVTVQDAGKHRVTIIEVPQSRQLVGTADGRFLRRVLKGDGTPECQGMRGYDIATRLGELGQADFTVQPLARLGRDALDPLERERLRQLIREYRGDQALLGLADVEFDAALGLTTRHEGAAVPAVVGVLMLGRPEVLEREIPTHEVAFQLLRGTDVVVNEFYRLPLGRVFERMMEHMRAVVTEQEVAVGMFRVPVPSIDRRAFREALVNALTHRDYAVLGQIYVRLKDDELTVSSPGGFVQGVTVDNLLRVDPTPRNPRLADVFKRLGLSERTGRGVDIIYEGSLRYGRRPPSYRRSTGSSVVVAIDTRPADLNFVEAIVAEERGRQRPLSLNALLVLGKLKSVKRATLAELTEELQYHDADGTRAAVEELVESGLVQAHGTGKGRTYTMSAALYRQLGQKAEHVRQTGFEPEQQRQMVLKYVREHGAIKRADVMELCQLSADQAKRLLAALLEDGLLTKSGSKRGVVYGRAP
jgi:ATP-dependent DNA helicase RecG